LFPIGLLFAVSVYGHSIDAMLAHDIVAVVAAGNSGPLPITLGSPATARGALTVGGASLAANERVLAELTLGPGKGAIYRPFAGPLMYFASSRGPQADGQLHPHVVAPGHKFLRRRTSRLLQFRQRHERPSPMVAGIAAVLRQAFPVASARQIRNAIIQSANPNFINFAMFSIRAIVCECGGRANLLAAGTAPDTPSRRTPRPR
jgi:subtilisin family serine protease